jgi:anti-sigma factor RsiW
VSCAAPARLGGLALQSCREASRANELPGKLLIYGRSFGSVVVLEQPGGGDPGGGLWGLLPGVSVAGADGRELVTPLGTVVRFARGGITYTVVGSLPRRVVEAVARGL